MQIIDISRPLSNGAPHWPGDVPTAYRLTTEMAQGASCNAGQITLSVHAGSHADAPYHYNPRGLAIDQVELERFIGPARVIDARGQPEITVRLFHGLSGAEIAATPRILFRTDSWGDPNAFPTTWPLPDRTLPGWLAERGVKLIGLDIPSVDELTSKELPIHHLLDSVEILILECLDLRGVEPGVYELIALPLKLRGGDGSPVRAVLRR